MDEPRSIIPGTLQEQNNKRRRRKVETSPWPPSKEAETARRLDAEDLILQSIPFSFMRERYLRIAEAHKLTFEWVFKDPRQEDRPWNNFAEWLEHGQGIYWVNGKAGSGKSTLMRFLYDDERTKDKLLKWAGHTQLDLAGFFFWNSGTPEQKSQTGLLRSLLYQLLHQHRELIPVGLPDIWNDEFLKPSEYHTILDWDLGELKQAFVRLSKQELVSTRICLFIDGLDEYGNEDEGSHADIVRLFEEMAASPNIKICLSSRPWSVFEDAFKTKAGLRLEDLTNHDISQYVCDKFCGNKKIIGLISAGELHQLQREVVAKTAGVFLWARLAIQSLLHDLTNEDQVSGIRRRLVELPQEFEDLFEYMLEHINPSYRIRASQIFQIVHVAPQQLEPEHDQIGLLDLALADDEVTESVLHGEIKPWTIEDLKLRCDDMDGRLLSYCAGLLEISPQASERYDSAVNYIHRTVKDWLDLPRAQNLLIGRTARTDFNPNASLLRSCVLQLKVVCIIAKRKSFASVSKYVQEAMRNARKATDCTGDSYSTLLDQLDQAATHHWQSIPRPSTDLPKRDLRKENWCNHLFTPVIKPWRMSISPSSPCYLGASPLPKVRFEESVLPPATIQHNDTFLSLSILYGLSPYVAEKLKQDNSLIRPKSGRPLLDYIADHIGPPNPHLVILLFDHGADPNQFYNGQTIWQHILARTSEISQNNQHTHTPKESQPPKTPDTLTQHHINTKQPPSPPWPTILTLFLQNGANPHAHCRRLEKFKYKGESHWKIRTLSALSIVKEFLENFPEGEADWEGEGEGEGGGCGFRVKEAREVERMLRDREAREYIHLSEEHGFYEAMVGRCRELADGAGGGEMA